MSDKNKILTALRNNQVPETPPPAMDPGCWVRFDDRLSHFAEMVAAVGGEVVRASEHGGAAQAIQSLAVHEQAGVIYSTLNEVPGTVDAEQIDDPHQLADVDLCLAAGELAVAENGAVWTPGPPIRQHRVVLFLSQHLILTVRADRILNNMHEAYEQIGLPLPGFGVFISGPSKTADIEQSLVIGAHGARSLHVVVTD